jgi:hypothetical protein
MSKDIIVYWAYSPMPDKNTYVSMMMNPPTPLFKTLPKRASNKDALRNYINCRGLPNLYKNTFLITSPIDANISIDVVNEKCWPVGEGSQFFIEENRPLEDMNRIDLDFSYIFFSEESLEMAQIPPFIHKTTFSEDAFIASGSFDISKWFRPIFPSFIFWKDRLQLKLKKDEPLFYFDFRTEKNIVLKQFEFTEEIFEIMNGSISYRNTNPLSSLQHLYDRFARSKKSQKLIKLIKENLID